MEEIWDERDGKIQRQVTAVVVGGGNRGVNYSAFALDFPSRLKIVAAAEPKPHRLANLKKAHQLKDDMTFADWVDLAKQPKLADAAIIATQDQVWERG